ncbi:MAG: chromosome segregation protein SMC [Anaerovoracaceae bacterium]
MYFKRIEMHGFKSFAEPVTIEFDKGITCVVGPNGSGKSNISDAIRWVLGEQSPKMLRGGKMEDVIFSGTASRKSRGMAEVTLVIDNHTGILPTPYNEVAITRRMYRSGESEYEINNNQCRMKDIRELLMDTGIGVDGYSLIGQGKISDIISNKTDSIREIFEETAGIVSYRTKKAETERKLASTTANMERVTDIVSEIESRIGTLKEDSEKAEEYIKLRDRYKALEINITLNNIENIDEKNKALKEDLDELSVEIEESKHKREELELLINNGQERSKNLEELLDEKKQELIEKIGEINNIENQSHVNKEKVLGIVTNIERLELEIKETEEKIEREKNSLGELLLNKNAIDERHKALSQSLDQCIEEFSAATSNFANGAEALESKKNSLFKLSNVISTKEAELKSIENLKGTLESRRVKLIEEMENENMETSTAEEELETAIRERDSLKNKKEELQNEVKNLKEEYSKVRSSQSECSKKLEEANIEISQVSTRKRTIEEMESNYEGYNYGVKFVMKSGTSGVCGVVAELIGVPDGLQVALETALGGTMQNIVCENDETAKRAIRLLKDNKAGRVTFLPIESINYRTTNKEAKVMNHSGFEGYAVDCVNFDEKYRGIISYILGNVIIADTMDNAVKISKISGKGMKVVTLDGEIINASGAVTGGKYKNNSANLLERKGEITKLEETIKLLIKKQQVETEKKKELEIREEALLKDATNKDSDYRNVEMQLLAKENEIEITKSLLNDYEENAKKWEVAISTIDNEQEMSNHNVEQIKRLISETSLELENLKEHIETDTLNHERNKTELDEINQKITEARIAVNTCEGEKNSVDSLIDRINETLEQHKADIEKKKSDLTENIANKNQLDNSFDFSESEVKAKEEEKQFIEDKIAKLTEERALENTKLSDLIKAKEEIDNKSASIQNQKYEIDIKQARLDTQLDNYKNKLWEEFEVSYLQALELKTEEFAMQGAIRENREIKNRIKELGEVNIGAIKEYESVSERYVFLSAQRDDINKSMEELRLIVSDMDKVIREKFKESFDEIVLNFEEIFVEFFGGGHGKITLDNEENPLEAVIEINAQPPGKQLKNINLLSGGEKTMTAIALMFAVLKTKPTPCCILDEVEAALDDHNIHVFANYLKNFEDIQFTLITHQKTTMEHADVMYGVTMPERGISKVFSLDLGQKLPL